MSGKDKNDEYFSLAPPKRSGWESFRAFLWNGETKEFLGRTAGSWAKIFGFYFVLYSFLAAFFAAMFMVFLQSLDHAKPKWQQKEGLIGSNPGLGFRPMPKNVESTLIQFDRGEANKDSWTGYTKQLEDFLEPYDKPESGSHVINCDFEKQADKKKHEVCLFKVTWLGPEVKTQKKLSLYEDKKCNKEDSFGYSRGNPCILLKLNKIYGWKPEPYDNIEELRTTVNKTIPESLLKVIEETSKNHDGNKSYLDMVWVECQGLNEVDKENIGVVQGNSSVKELKLRYTPHQGFPGYYFPYKKTPGYQSPLVAVQFIDPLPGVLITVECRAYAKNIIYDKQRRLGLVKFELKVGE